MNRKKQDSELKGLSQLMADMEVLVGGNPFLESGNRCLVFLTDSYRRKTTPVVYFEKDAKCYDRCSNCKRLVDWLSSAFRLGNKRGDVSYCLRCYEDRAKYYKEKANWTCVNCHAMFGGSIRPHYGKGRNGVRTSSALCSQCFLSCHSKCRDCHIILLKSFTIDVAVSGDVADTGPFSLSRCLPCIEKRGLVKCGSDNFVETRCKAFYNKKEMISYVNNGVEHFFCKDCSAKYITDCKLCGVTGIRCRSQIYVREIPPMVPRQNWPPTANRNRDYATVESCKSCYDSLAECLFIQSYSFKPAPSFLPKGQKEYIGVELEVCRDRTKTYEKSLDEMAVALMAAVNKGNRRIYCKGDSSIGASTTHQVQGFEIVTHPQTLAEQTKTWKLFSDNRPQGLRSFFAGSCGMHVHMSRTGFTGLSLKKFCYFVNCDSNQPYIHDIAQRKSNTYSNLQHKKLTDADSNNTSRYCAVNLTNQQTVEVRIFRGNVRYDRIMKGLEFCEALKEYAKVSSFSSLNYDDFVKWVAERSKTYTFLHNYHCELKYFGEEPTVVSSQSPKYFSLESSLDSSEIAEER